jgi:uncharacterized membrane protein YbhN (UPF0104 family)
VALPPIEAHLLCAGLVAVDLAARTARMRLLLQAFGHRVSPRRLLAVSLVGDAGAALTPFRAGGDVARVAALRRAGVSVSRIVLALAAEAVQTWTVIVAGGTILFWLYGGQAWHSFAAGLRDMGHRVPPAAVAGIVLASGLLGAFLLRRLRALRPRRSKAAKPVPRPPVLKLLATVPLTVVSIAARVLILPVLATAVASTLSFGAVAAASFALLHGQMILPTPAGAGAVDFSFLAGMSAGGEAGLLLVCWRLYTAGIGVAVGSALAATALGKSVFNRRRTSLAPARCRNARPSDTTFADPLPAPPPPGCDCC